MALLLQSNRLCWRSNDKRWCYGKRNSSSNSESSPLFTCRIPRLGNYQNLSYKHKELQTEQEWKLLQRKLAKLLWELKSTPVSYNKKSSLVFLACLSVIENLLRFVCFATGYAIWMGAFSFSKSVPWDRLHFCSFLPVARQKKQWHANQNTQQQCRRHGVILSIKIFRLERQKTAAGQR